MKPIESKTASAFSNHKQEKDENAFFFPQEEPLKCHSYNLALCIVLQKIKNNILIHVQGFKTG